MAVPPLSATDLQVLDTNRAHWESVSAHHLQSPYYPVDAVLAGGSSLTAVEREEVGDLSAKSGLHLQCGIGLDTISLERLGARMTGVDYSQPAIQIAQGLADRCHSACHFAVADAQQQLDLPDATFDFVFTSKGVLRWLPRLDLWARTIFSKLRPGGFLYVFESHPLLYRVIRLESGNATLAGDYFDEFGKRKRLEQTHAGSITTTTHPLVVHFDWPLHAIVGAVLGAGLRLESYREHASACYERKGLLIPHSDGLFYPVSGPTPIPLAFSLRALRPTE